MISSSSNAQIKYLTRLQKKHALREADKVFVCEGRKMFQEVLQYAKDSVVKAYFAESFLLELQKTGEDFGGIDYEAVADNVFLEAAQTVTPQGVLAIIKQPSYNLENIVNKENARILVLEDLRDPGNLGTVLRTAEGAGMDGVILSAESVDMFNPKVIRSTMGAIYRMPFYYASDFYEQLRQLKQRGFFLCAAHLQGSVEYDSVEYPKKMAMLIGNEANGLTSGAAELADCRVRIPMEGKAESLNAAVASAVLMYEIYRQRRKKA